MHLIIIKYCAKQFHHHTPFDQQSWSKGVWMDASTNTLCHWVQSCYAQVSCNRQSCVEFLMLSRLIFNLQTRPLLYTLFSLLLCIVTLTHPLWCSCVWNLWIYYIDTTQASSSHVIAATHIPSSCVSCRPMRSS